MNITQDELDALFSREKKIIYGVEQKLEDYSQVVTGDPSAYNPTSESTEAQTAQYTIIRSLLIFKYIEGCDPDAQVGVPGLKVVVLGTEQKLYKLNERYGSYYHISSIY